VQQDDRRPRAAVTNAEHSLADVDSVERELVEHGGHVSRAQNGRRR
jgi:hypothetical protein